MAKNEIGSYQRSSITELMSGCIEPAAYHPTMLGRSTTRARKLMPIEQDKCGSDPWEIEGSDIVVRVINVYS